MDCSHSCDLGPARLNVVEYWILIVHVSILQTITDRFEILELLVSRLSPRSGHDKVSKSNDKDHENGGCPKNNGDYCPEEGLDGRPVGVSNLGYHMMP